MPFRVRRSGPFTRRDSPWITMRCCSRASAADGQRSTDSAAADPGATPRSAALARLGLLDDAQHVAAPHLGNVGDRIAGGTQPLRHLWQRVDILKAGHAAAAIPIG